MRWNSAGVRQLICTSLEEDAAVQDITSRSLIPRHLTIEAEILSKASGVICGLPLASAFFKTLDPQCVFTVRVRDGQGVNRGAKLCRIRGDARAILAAERSALNALQHLSGIATYTRLQVQYLQSKSTAIYDTRKTIPGWRELQKYAVGCGGGKNHRMSLKAGILIKDNHLKICRLIQKDWIRAINQLRARRPSLPVEMEVQTDRDLLDAVRLAPDQVLLDNMEMTKLRAVVSRLRAQLPRAEIEVSGGVQTRQLRTLGRLGVERISMGRLTHSAPAFDCALDITRVFHPR